MIDQPEHPRLLLRIDFVGRVGDSMVVGMEPGREEQNRDAALGEVKVVRAIVESLLGFSLFVLRCFCRRVSQLMPALAVPALVLPALVLPALLRRS